MDTQNLLSIFLGYFVAGMVLIIIKKFDDDDPGGGMMTHNERAELANGRWAMLGIIAGFVSYATTGHLFFGVL